jgi:hypothetical protein
MMDLTFVVEWLKASSASTWINERTWVWPLCEILHFIGLSLLIGVTGFFDLRLMGFFRRVSMAAARDLMPLALAGFAINLITGLVFLIGLPGQYAHNRIFWYKVAFILVAGANAAVYESRWSARVLALEPGADSPATVKLTGALSLVAWFAVLYCGRMLPFLGDAF